jgi:hypothetical protein
MSRRVLLGGIIVFLVLIGIVLGLVFGLHSKAKSSKPQPNPQPNTQPKPQPNTTPSPCAHMTITNMPSGSSIGTQIGTTDACMMVNWKPNSVTPLSTSSVLAQSVDQCAQNCVDNLQCAAFTAQRDSFMFGGYTCTLYGHDASPGTAVRQSFFNSTNGIVNRSGP